MPTKTKTTAKKAASHKRAMAKELADIKEQMCFKWQRWRQTFDHFLEYYICEGEPITSAAQRAEEIADLRESILGRRKPPGLEWWEGEWDGD